ncbi:hypothetical protein F7R28_03670 [Polaromonas sp. Pch-P]|nr:hypothetical protein F7R28_03670 [Polaromonas sp. Pch-P]
MRHGLRAEGGRTLWRWTLIPPEAACGRLPLKGAPLAARQSRFRGGLGLNIFDARITRHCSSVDW